MNTISYSSDWRYKAVIVSIFLSAVAYLAFSLWGGWKDVGHAISRVGWLGILAVLCMSLVNYTLRFIRWQSYLSALGHPTQWKPSLIIYLAGFALTTTPGKAGEAFRGVLLKPRGVPYSKSFAAFFSERLSDLFAVVLLTLFGLSLYPAAQPMIIVGGGLVVLSLLALSQKRMLQSFFNFFSFGKNAFASFLKHILSVLIEAHSCHKLSLLTVSTLLSIIAWGAEAIAFYWILHWMGADISVEFAMFVYAISMLAGALSFMPGGLGGAEVVMIGLLVFKGMPNPDAVAATLLIRLATLWFAVMLGVLAYFGIHKIDDNFCHDFIDR